MKILFLTHSFYPTIGGLEIMAETLAQEFHNAGHELHLITWTEDFSPTKRFPYAIIRNPDIATLIKEHLWAAVVYENNPCLRLGWPNLFLMRPLVISLQTWVSRIDGRIGFQDILKLYWLKRARKVISVSEALKKCCFPKSIVIDNCYQEKKFFKIEDIAKDVDFVFLGRLVSDKGADMAIRAIAALSSHPFYQKKAKPTLSIIGTGPEFEKLKRMSIDLGVDERIFFTGALREYDLTIYLNRHRYLLVPSVWEEPFGIVALEGMACGCLPIVSDGGGLPDAIGKAGIKFRRKDLNDFVESIIKVLSDPLLERDLRSLAPAHLKEHESAMISKRYLELIEK